MGATKRPFYRVVVTDKRNPRDGRFIENIGKYHPLEDPSLIEIDEERALYWLRTGAQPSDTVRTLFAHVGVWERFVAERPSATRAADALARSNQLKFAKLSKREAEATKRASKETVSEPAPSAKEPEAAPEAEASDSASPQAGTEVAEQAPEAAEEIAEAPEA